MSVHTVPVPGDVSSNHAFFHQSDVQRGRSEKLCAKPPSPLASQLPFCFFPKLNLRCTVLALYTGVPRRKLSLSQKKRRNADALKTRRTSFSITKFTKPQSTECTCLRSNRPFTYDLLPHLNQKSLISSH